MHHRATAVAGRAIHLAIQEGRFQAEDLRRGLDDPPSSSTVTRVLRQLEADGWLSRSGETSRIWRAGTKARAHGDMGEAALKKANKPSTAPGARNEGSGFDFSW